MIALDMPCGPAMVERIARAWDSGDAVFPLDQRAPNAHKSMLLDIVQPTRVCTTTDEVVRPGLPAEPGDAAIILTSGTTGSPKAVVLSKDSLSAGARRTHARLDVGTTDAWLCCLPPWHVGGFGVIARSVLTGTRVIAVEGFDPASYRQAALEGATFVALVSTAMARVDPSLYRTILLGGSRPPEIRPPNCVTTYGMTETGGGVVYDGLPLDDVEVLIRDGVIHLRAPMLMTRYVGAPAPVDSSGWYRTNDLGHVDEHGRLHVEGRIDDVIITGGEKVWPETVERCIDAHPSVKESCVVGSEDPEWGQSVTAWIVTQGGDEPSLESIRDHVKDSLPPHCAPKRIAFIDSLPRTSLGKIERVRMRSRPLPD